MFILSDEKLSPTKLLPDEILTDNLWKDFMRMEPGVFLALQAELMEHTFGK